MFHAVFPQLTKLDILSLHNPHAAILSAMIFNAIIIFLLTPLALRGVAFKALGATAQLRRNLVIYGIGGLITPFILIKLIDLLIIGPAGVH
jgi:K+-transporting ATPase ATPase B chain